MHFLLDQNVAKSVAETLKRLGYTCEFSRDLIPANAADPVVAVVAEQRDAILISHDKDFKAIAPRVAEGHKARYRRLSRIALECPEVMGAARLEELMPIIEITWQLQQAKKDTRMIFHVQRNGFRVG